MDTISVGGSSHGSKHSTPRYRVVSSGSEVDENLFGRSSRSNS